MLLYVNMTWIGGCCNEYDVALTSKESSIALVSSCLLVLCVRNQAEKERPAFHIAHRELKRIDVLQLSVRACKEFQPLPSPSNQLVDSYQAYLYLFPFTMSNLTVNVVKGGVKLKM